jgi:hypothetical protein
MANSHFTVGLSQKPDDLRFGYTNQKSYLYSLSRDRTILNGINLFITLMNKFIQAYTNVKLEDHTFLTQKDLYISMALGKMVRCCQTVDSAYEKLTPHAESYWKNTFAYNKVWGQVPINYLNTNSFDIPDGYYGPAGSLGFYLYTNRIDTNSLSPIQIIEAALDSFWSSLSISTSISALEQHQIILNRVGVLSIPFDIYTTALNYIWANPNFHPTILGIVQELRSQAINSTDFESLKQKFIFGLVKQPLITALTNLQSFINNYSEVTPLPSELKIPSINPNSFTSVLNNILDICKPAGFALVYQVFAIQSLVRTARIITNSSLDVINTPYYLSTRYGYNPNLLLSIANNLSTMYDAYAALAYFNTMQEARGYSYFIYQKIVELINYDINITIPFSENNFRLQGFN